MPARKLIELAWRSLLEPFLRDIVVMQIEFEKLLKTV
jgi:hypothetical protein